MVTLERPKYHGKLMKISINKQNKYKLVDMNMIYSNLEKIGHGSSGALLVAMPRVAYCDAQP